MTSAREAAAGGRAGPDAAAAGCALPQPLFCATNAFCASSRLRLQPFRARRIFCMKVGMLLMNLAFPALLFRPLKRAGDWGGTLFPTGKPVGYGSCARYASVGGDGHSFLIGAPRRSCSG